MQEFFQQHLAWVVALIVLAVALTIFVFRKRKFERGYRKGEAADPERVKRENRPDEWSRSH
jgi:formate hydrogenlyase subunit 3/multisubunit Na+/H+ antiporter MnhD subunit